MHSSSFTACVAAAVLATAGAAALAESAPGEPPDPLAEPAPLTEREALSIDPDAEVRPLFDANPRRAGTRMGPDAGDFEFTLTGSASNDGNFKQGAFGVDASLGYYLTREVSLELRQGVGFQDLGESFWSGSTRVAADYHFDLARFDLERLRPFVGVVGGAFYGEQIRDTGALGLEGGVKYYVKPDTFLYGRVEHHWLFDGTTDDRVFGNRHMLYTIGIGFNF